MKPEPLKNKGFCDIHRNDLKRKAYWDEDIKSAVEWYKEWKTKAVSTFLKHYPEYNKEWIQFYASLNHRCIDIAYKSVILNKAFEDVMR